MQGHALASVELQLLGRDGVHVPHGQVRREAHGQKMAPAPINSHQPVGGGKQVLYPGCMLTVAVGQKIPMLARSIEICLPCSVAMSGIRSGLLR